MVWQTAGSECVADTQVLFGESSHDGLPSPAIGASMNPVVADSDFVLYQGDALSVLKRLPPESVHCCVTSPPYWGLRDYGHEWQLGLEATPELYVARMVAVFREVRRVLRSDGTCWLNIGDSYANDTKWGGTTGGKHVSELHGAAGGLGRGKRETGLKAKDLVGIPWRLAFALQADGWYLRSDIIWSKPNPMPESVTDRPTKAHEYVFLLSKSARYFYDADAIREPAEWARWGDQTNGKHEGSGSVAGWIGDKSKAELQQRGKTWDERKAMGFRGDTKHPTTDAIEAGLPIPSFAANPAGRNKRSVWEIATEPYPDAHFATFPQALVEPCILAGTSERGCCPVCGAPWERETETAYDAKGRTTNGPRSTERRHETAGFSQRLEKSVETTGWRPTCEHIKGYERMGWTEYLPAPVPCTVLDPFLGSGTTALVARRLGRKTIGIELSAEYAQLAARRLQQLSLLA